MRLLDILLCITLSDAFDVDCIQYLDSDYASFKPTFMRDIQYGLTVSTLIFEYNQNLTASTFLEYYGNSTSWPNSIWMCMDLYSQYFVESDLGLIGYYIDFDSTLAGTQINDVLSPLHTIHRISNDFSEELYVVNYCQILSMNMNPINISDWKLNDTNFFDQYLEFDETFWVPQMEQFNIDAHYYYMILPYLTQYINLRFDFISLFYNNTRDIYICDELLLNYDAKYELDKYFEITSKLLLMYFNTYLLIASDLKVTHISSTSIYEYFITTFQSSLFCRWLDISFEISNGEITWDDFAGVDFSQFSTECEAAFMEYQLYYNNGYCRANKPKLAKVKHVEDEEIYEKLEFILSMSIGIPCCCIIIVAIGCAVKNK
eukprot:434860_1